jgi:two-component system response regulator MtrA
MTDRKKILVVEDDHFMNESLCIFLGNAGYDTLGVFDGTSALREFENYKPDLIMLDVMIPEPNGIAVCEKIRETSGVPIFMLTALTDKEDELKGLYAGADDYITKPYDTDKILARIKARFRTVSAPEGVTELRIGVAGHEVRRDGERISLTPLEFSLLQTLAEMPKQVFSREMLLEKVWGYQYKADTRLVNVHVQRLRSKIEDDPEDPKIVVTERGVGYKAGATS